MNDQKANLQVSLTLSPNGIVTRNNKGRRKAQPGWMTGKAEIQLLPTTVVFMIVYNNIKGSIM
jgi:hypothetical protein